MPNYTIQLNKNQTVATVVQDAPQRTLNGDRKLTKETLGDLLETVGDDWAEIGIKIEHDRFGVPTQVFLTAWANSDNPVMLHEFKKTREVPKVTRNSYLGVL